MHLPQPSEFSRDAWRASMADAMPTSARVMGVTKDLGIIAAGKLADMILIDGDPAKNIRDTRNITTVIKGGKV
jgi:imidazolonepropionase-like amidohydrolase